MIGHAHAHGVATAGHPIVDRARSPPHDERERTGPARVGQHSRHVGQVDREIVDLRGARDVDDHRMRPGPALDFVEALHGIRVGGVRAEPVHRLGREGDEPAAAQDTGRAPDLSVLVPRGHQ